MKRLVTLITLILIVLNVNSQSTKSLDSVVLSVKDAEKVLRSAERGKLYKEEVISQNKRIELLTRRLENKDIEINNLIIRLENAKKISDAHESNFNIERTKYIDLSNSFNNYKKIMTKELKKANRQKTVKTIGGTIVGLAVGILVGSLLIN